MTGPLFPENYSKIWIRGRFITMAGVAVRGKLTLAPTVTGGGLVNRSLKLIMSAASFSADTDADGYVALQVPATNDPDITPVNFTYAVTTPIGQKFSIVAPYDTTPLNSVGDPLHGQPVIELIDVVPVGSSGGVGQLLRGIGIQSMVDNGAGGLLITYTDGSTTTVAMPSTVQGPAGPTGPVGPVGPAGPTGPGGGVTKLVDLTDVTATGATVGQLLTPSTVSGGVPTAHKYVDPGAALPAALQPPSKLPPLFTGQQIHTGFAAGHGFTVTQGGTAGDNLNDASDAILGTQSVKLVTDGIGTAKRLDKTAGVAIDLTDRHPVLWVKTDSVAHLQAIEVWFGQFGGFGVAYRLSPWNSTNADGRLENLQVGQWTRLSFPFSTQTLINTFGAPNRAALNTIRIQVQDDNTGNPVTVHVNGVGSMPEPRTVWPNGVVSLTFDDSYDNQYTVGKAKMDQYGFPGVAHNICEIVGQTGRMTVQQLRDAQNQSGWQVGAHAYLLNNHNAVGGFPSLDDATLFDEFRRMKQWSIDNGFQDAEHLAYPQGYFSDRVLRMAERFFTTSRSTISRTQETWPPSEPHKLRVRNILSTTTLANLQAWVDDAYTNAYWLILVFHSIDDTNRAGGNSLPTVLFGQMIDYIAAKGIPVVTTADAAAGRRLPRGAAASMAPGKANDLYLDGAQATTAGTETYNRLHATQGILLTSGRVQLTRFTPHRDRTISSLAFATGATVGSGLTLARLGLYLINTDDSQTLVAATLNDATMGTAASTWYSKPLDIGGGLPATYTLRRGQRYAFGMVIVGTTPPNVVGVVPAAAGLTALAPNAGQQLNSQTDLPTSIAAGGASNTNNMPYGYLA